MNTDKNIQMIGELSNANGASGFEDEVVQILQRYGAGLGDAKVDAMRNLYLHRTGSTGTKPLVLLDAHTDEVGLMVQAIKPNGTLQFVPLGGWVPASLVAQPVRVRTNSGTYIPGVVASKPPHYTTEAERNAAPKIDSMVIDVGASSKQEAIKSFDVRIGEPVVPEATFAYQQAHGLLTGKAFDCRLGCAALMATMHALAGQVLGVDLVAAFASQEEVGTRGAAVMSNTLRPSAAIVFEGTPADDTTTDSYAVQSALRKGPMLRHIDARMITNPRFLRLALDIGAELGIPVQEGVRAGGATNAAAIHLAGQGVPVIVIGLPVRYIHTHHGIAAYSDFEAAVNLACAVIQRLDQACIAAF